MQFSAYQIEEFYDEMFGSDGSARPHFQLVLDIIESLSDGQLIRCQHAAERLLLQMGITFNVYGDAAGTERIFPFDLIPRIVPPHEWERIERGLKQRIHALNCFIDDIYHDQKILQGRGHSGEEVISVGQSLPPAVRRASTRRGASGATSPAPIWCATATARSTCSRTTCACPSGVSYVLENREVMKRTFPEVFEGLARPPGGRLPEPPAGDAGVHRAATRVDADAWWC